MSVAQIRLLVLAESLESVITFPRRADFVFVRAVEDAEAGQDENAELGGKVDCVTSVKFWCVGGDVCPSVMVLIYYHCYYDA